MTDQEQTPEAEPEHAVQIGRFEIPLEHGISQVRLPQGADIFTVDTEDMNLHVFAAEDPTRPLTIRNLAILMVNQIFDINKVLKHLGPPMRFLGKVKGTDGNEYCIFEQNQQKAAANKMQEALERAAQRTPTPDTPAG